ncbi:formate/nitrite transporter family protein [Sphingomonas japonica]|uniref:Formate/nitrite transporter FocA (FNT family) n=1 Tax=Sphingomonas japonica TaxID=511662 RepID=A0ABX0TX73_9SPHN|nr:formate/nitrite transporter family protein [Sphingomonas japonica]NIJ22898.1 formate/nitrite transporter FocA (FNT family) [Sphingomonas japonica]
MDDTTRHDAAIEAEEDTVALDVEDEAVVEDRRAATALVVHEVVRRQGIEELERPAASLIWSGIAAGIVIGLSLVGKATAATALPDGSWTPLLQAAGYSIGFLVIILGRLQLFTESTLSAVLPLATQFTRRNLLRTLRLWSLVLAANLVGTFAFAAFVAAGGFGPEKTLALIDVSRVLLDHFGKAAFLGAIPAGLLLATVVWTLPSAEGQKLTLIVVLTGLIDLAGFTHVIAGSAEMWILLMVGEMRAGQALGSFFMPALLGNIVGGSALFALLAHAQVHSEIEQSDGHG